MKALPDFMPGSLVAFINPLPPALLELLVSAPLLKQLWGEICSSCRWLENFMELADFCWSNKINNKKIHLGSKHLQLEVPFLSERWWQWLSSTLFHAMLSAYRHERWEKIKIKGTLMASLINCLYRQRTLRMPKALQISFRQKCCQKISLLWAFLPVGSLQFRRPCSEQTSPFPAESWLLLQPWARFAQLRGVNASTCSRHSLKCWKTSTNYSHPVIWQVRKEAFKEPCKTNNLNLHPRLFLKFIFCTPARRKAQIYAWSMTKILISELVRNTL